MRKGRYGSALILAAAMAGLSIGSKTALAQFSWDPNQTPLTPSGGSGTWDNTTLNWSNGTSDVAWNSTTANFEGPGGAVMIGAPITATAINLNAGGYTFSGSNPANTLSLSAGSLTQAAGISGINEFAGPVNFSNSTVNINGGKLKLSNALSTAANSITNTTFNVASGSTLEFSAVTGAGSLGNGSVALNGGTLQIDPTVNGTVGSINSHYVSSSTGFTTSIDYFAAALPNSPSVLQGPISFNPDSQPAPFYSGGPTTNFAARFTGAIDISTAGQYTFATTSDDASRLYIDNRLVVMDDGFKNALTLTSAPITLSAGLHEFRLDYAQAGGNSSLAMNYSGPDTGNNSVLVPISAMQTVDTISQGNNVSVTRDSAIVLSGNNFTQVGMGGLSFNQPSGSATLTVTGDPGRSLHFSGTSLISGSTNTIDTSTDVFVGQLSTTGNATFVKT
ncbi:MAG TPA: PA14 domain-containing protein, partial [Tepidisphaeraceae bacterium]|nr:PA14 domain-containing protein [Tepidisphaeraceae bacterium]